MSSCRTAGNLSTPDHRSRSTGVCRTLTEFPVVALVGAGRMPAEGEDEREEARLFYVGATRATQRLVIGASGGGRFAARL